MKLPGRAGLLSIVLVALTAAAGLAETRVGLIGGAAMTWLSGGEWADTLDNGGYGNRAQGSANYGFFLDMDVNETYSLRPEFQVFEIKGKGAGDTAGMWMSTRTFHIPILLKAKYGTRWGMFYGFLGPSVDLIVDKIDTTVRVPSLGTETTVEEDAYNGAGFGVDLGIGYKTPLSSDVVETSIEIRYHRLLARFLRDDDTASNNLSLSLVLTFPLP